MRETVEQATRWLQDGVGFGRATAVHVVRPSPFRAGRTLLVAEDGRIAGAVSAGCVEGAAAEAVRAARLGRYREVVHFGVTDARAADVGLVCGGNLDVLVEPDVPAEVLAAAAGEGNVAVATPLPAGREAPEVDRVLLDVSGIRSGSLGDPEADAALAELRARPRFARASAGRSRWARATCSSKSSRRRPAWSSSGQWRSPSTSSAWRTPSASAPSWSTDERAFATRERFPDADEILVGWLDELADVAGVNETASVAVLTHDAKFDDPALAVALGRRARYVGALGSRRTHAARLARLRELGTDEADLARIHGPIGLDLGGDTPAEIALAILAEIIAERHHPMSHDAGVESQGRGSHWHRRLPSAWQANREHPQR